MVVWFVSVLQGWSAVVLYRIEVREHIYHGQLVLRHECTIREDLSEIIFVIWFNFLTMYLIPLAIVTGLYSKIFAVFYLSRIRVGAASQSSGRHRKRIVRMLVSIVLIFAACQCPIHIWRIYVYNGGGAFEGFLVLHQIFDMISFANSWLNVVVYVSFNESFRRAYRDILGLKRRGDMDAQPGRTRTVSGMPTGSSLRPPNSMFHDELSVISGKNRSSESKSSASMFSRHLSAHSPASNHRHLSVTSGRSVFSRELPNNHLDSSV
jgi:hypothetical protein